MKFPVLVKILMCDACRLLGTPWLPEPAVSRARRRTAGKAMKLRQAGKPAEPATAGARPKRRAG